MEESTKLSQGDRLRARAANRPLLTQKLSDADARVASIILEHIADCFDKKDEPVIEVPKVVKRQAD